MQMIIIAGQAGVGKTTAAKILAKEVFASGQIPVLLSFAGPLKEEAEKRGYSKKEHPDKYRKYCQEIGLARRKEDSDYWVKRFDDRVKEVIEKEKKDIEDKPKYWERVIIVDDCRYPNEVAYGILYNATLLFISAGERKIKDQDADWRNDASEEMARSLDTGKDPMVELFSNVVFNDRTIKMLTKIIKDSSGIWSGVEVSCEDDDGCQCSVCAAKRNGELPLLDDVINDIMTMLREISLFEDDEEDEDETPEESNT